MAVEIIETDYYGTDEDENSADIDHPIMLMMRDNLYKALELNPSQSNADAQYMAFKFLEQTWFECAVDGDDTNIDKNLYISVMEEMFIKLVEDMNFILKAFYPHCLKDVLEEPRGLPNKSALDKVIFSTLFPLETSGYKYPQSNPPYKDDALSGYKTNTDAAWRGAWDADHDTIIDHMDCFPSSWRHSVQDYLVRTAEYLYGQPDAVDFAEADTDYASACS